MHSCRNGIGQAIITSLGMLLGAARKNFSDKTAKDNFRISEINRTPLRLQLAGYNKKKVGQNVRQRKKNKKPERAERTGSDASLNLFILF